MEGNQEGYGGGIKERLLVCNNKKEMNFESRILIPPTPFCSDKKRKDVDNCIARQHTNKRQKKPISANVGKCLFGPGYCLD